MGNTGRRVWTEGQEKVIEETIAANEDLPHYEVGKLAKDALIEKYGEKAHFYKESINTRISLARQHNGSISEWRESRRTGRKMGHATKHLPKDYKKIVTAHFEVCLCEPRQSNAVRDARLSEYKSPGSLVSLVYPQDDEGPRTELSKKNLEALVKDGFPKDYAELKRRADDGEVLVQLGGNAGQLRSGTSRRGKNSRNSKDTKRNGGVKDEDEEGVDQNDGNNKRKIGGSGSDGTRKRIKKEESEDDGEWKGGKGKGEGKKVEREKRMKIKKECE